jgi:hypothetical protein
VQSRRRSRGRCGQPPSSALCLQSHWSFAAPGNQKLDNRKSAHHSQVTHGTSRSRCTFLPNGGG